MGVTGSTVHREKKSEVMRCEPECSEREASENDAERTWPGVFMPTVPGSPCSRHHLDLMQEQFYPAPNRALSGSAWRITSWDPCGISKINQTIGSKNKCHKNICFECKPYILPCITIVCITSPSCPAMWVLLTPGGYVLWLITPWTYYYSDGSSRMSFYWCSNFYHGLKHNLGKTNIDFH